MQIAKDISLSTLHFPMQIRNMFAIAMLIGIACIMPASAGVTDAGEITNGDPYVLSPAFTFTESTGFYAQVTYDPTLFTYDSITISNSAMSSYVNTDTAGTIKILYVGGEGVDAPFDITFTSIGIGDTSIVISGEYSDSNFMPQSFDSQAYEISIKPVYIRGDLNDDGVVDLNDFTIGLNDYWWTGTYNEELDFNENERLDVGDMMKFFHDGNIA